MANNYASECRSLIDKYESLKSNYTKMGAIEFYNMYSSNMKLSAILNCAGFIVKEPYKGFDFIKDLVLTKCLPISSYFALASAFKTIAEDAKATISAEQYSDLMKLYYITAEKELQFKGCVKHNNYDENIMKLYDAFPNLNIDDIDITNIQDAMHIAFFTKNYGIIDQILMKFYNEPKSTSSDEEREKIADNLGFTYLLKSMMKSDYFKTEVNKLPTKIRLKLLEISEMDREYLKDKLLTVHEKAVDIYGDFNSALDAMFESVELDEVLSESTKESKINNLLMERTLNDAEIVYYAREYMNNMDDDVSDDMTFESPSSQVLSIYMTELQRDNERIENELIALEYRDDGEATEVIEKNHKIEEPPKYGTARQIQNKALDADVQMKKATAVGKQKFQDVKNAAKAVGKVPSNITAAVDDQIKEWDDMDDNRRKKYMIEPGTRKIYWKTLKMAIAHGLAFKINPIINIILLIGSKLSAEKNKRIRNELSAELETEMKVIEQKIEDAKSKGDNKAVYKMMRMRDKLNQERSRVIINSKVL